MAAKPGQSLETLLARINKDQGAGSVMQLGDQPMADVEVFSTGSIGLDEALGLGGLPFGRIIELYGPESSGKTTIALHAAAEVQKLGFLVSYIDVEHALDPDWARVCGVDTDALLLSQPDSGEQALQIAEDLGAAGQLTDGRVRLIVIDSVAALVPRAEIEGAMGDSHVGLQARLMSQALRKLTGVVHGTGTTVLFINQLREKVGVIFGSPEITSGGKALKFYASMRLDVRRIETLKDGTESVGNHVRVKVVKNKLRRPFCQGEFDIMFGQGISKAGELIDLGVARGVVLKAGAWYTYGGEQLGQGKEKARLALLEQPDLATEIERLVRERKPERPVPPRPRLVSPPADRQSSA